MIRVEVTLNLSSAMAVLEPRERYCGARIPGALVGKIVCLHPGSKHRANDNACTECRCEHFASRPETEDLAHALSKVGILASA